MQDNTSGGIKPYVRGIKSMREFFSASTPCSSGCQYCFAKWGNKNTEFLQADSTQRVEDGTIVYPCCDGEFLRQQRYIECMRDFSHKSKKVYFSISTKQSIADEEIARIGEFDRELRSTNRGFVKLAISISNISMLEEIEPGTISYLQRLELAEKIQKEGIFFSLTIKPILPFIQTEEYRTIIKDFSRYTKYFLLGGLYVNKETEFYSRYISPNTKIIRRVVSWLPDHPVWDYVEDEAQFRQIREYAEQIGNLIFDSDEQLINYYIGQGAGLWKPS